MPAYKRRKRLTQRVADRQAGRDLEPESSAKRWSRTISRIAYAISLVGLGLLAYEALQTAQGAKMSLPTLIAYAGLFIGGRLIKLVMDTGRPFM